MIKNRGTFSTAKRLFLQKFARYGASFALLAASQPASAQGQLVRIRTAQVASGGTRVVFDLSNSTRYHIFSLTGPDRIVIDLADTRESITTALHKRTRLLTGIRMANRADGGLRVVLDLEDQARVHSFKLPPDVHSNHRLVVDIHSDPANPTPIKTRTQEQLKQKKDFVIVLDPGHGGRDPGAIGKKGTREKDVTLAVAKKIKKLFNQTNGYRALLTREGDQFIALRNRVKKARDLEADLFISIHADSFKNPRVKGASVYALSLTGATSEAARWIAAKENGADLIGGISLDDKDDLIASVLLDLSQTATIQDSLELGSDVLKNIGKVSSLNNKHVQQAAFAVLTAPDMPSILVETAFLSNPQEEKKLRTNRHQQKIAQAVFTGIKSHLQPRRT